MGVIVGLDIGSNSVGSHWADLATGAVHSAISIFPAGVDESDEKRGDPKNAKRRLTRRSRVTLGRRAARKRALRLKLISCGLLPPTQAEFQKLCEEGDPLQWRRKGLDHPLTPHEFGRALLHMAQRRGALGLKIADAEDGADADDDGKVKAAISAMQAAMKQRNARTVGEFLAMLQEERVMPITTEDRRPENRRNGPREYRQAIRNKGGSYEHCADRVMIRDEFARLWEKQRQFSEPLRQILSDDLRKALDDESGDAIWRHKGLLFGQRRTYWDTGTLGRCDLHPEERCVPHADRYASQYLVAETLNNLRIIERGKEVRPLSREERAKLKTFLSGPLGQVKTGKQKGQPKRSVSVTDLREAMGGSAEGWGRATKTSQFRFNIENDEDRQINTDWFSREIIHGAVTIDQWVRLSEQVREGINRAILKFDPENAAHAGKLKAGAMQWAGLSEEQAEAVIAAWSRRPKVDKKRLNLSRRAVRNLLSIMDRDEPWPDANRPGQFRWLTQIEARKLIAEEAEFKNVSTGQVLDEQTRRRYATGTKGATARDRHYMRKHLLKRNGQVVHGPDGLPLHEPPPAPMISNPVVRKAIHEVRRHLIEYMTHFGRKPDEVYVELSRQAKMGKKDADRLLFRNRLRNRIRNDIISAFDLGGQSSTQQRAAVDRVVLCAQQRGSCPLCGQGGLSERLAAAGTECEIAHIIPRASGGHNGLSNVVLAHTQCNRNMQRMTPRQFWNEKFPGGYDEAIAKVEKLYGEIERPKGDVKTADGNALWLCYFDWRDDKAKIERFKMDVKDIGGMTQRQDAATKYAARQVMAYLSDALFDGKGLPEGGGQRRIFTTDGLWTSRLRREWGLSFDPHQFKAKGLNSVEEHARKEKNRGDHRHHAVDAIVIAHTTAQVRNAWEEREKQADRDGINTADEVAMENYRRTHRLAPPPPFQSREEFHEAVRRAVFGEGEVEKPICHRPVKRKLIGALHEETLFRPVSPQNNLYAGKLLGGIVNLKPNHLRVPQGWDELSVKLEDKALLPFQASVIRRELAAMKDPPPGKSGILRDRDLRDKIRKCLRNHGVDPDDFSSKQIKSLCPPNKPEEWKLRLPSGVPIRSAVLLRTMSDPVLIGRKRPDYATGDMVPDENPASRRAYVGGNNHHIEIRAVKNKKGVENWSGQIVTAFEAAQRKIARLRARRNAGIPAQHAFRQLSKQEREKFTPALRDIEKSHPLVDRRDNEAQGGAFVMSLAEGEMLYMKHKQTQQVGYFVVAKLDKPQGIVLVPHWDARSATERKDADGNKVPNSAREDFTATPNDLQRLAPPGHPHAVKVRVSPLGQVTIMTHD